MRAVIIPVGEWPMAQDREEGSLANSGRLQGAELCPGKFLPLV